MASTDDFSVGGGTPLVFGIEDFDRPFWITPKYRIIKADKVQAAVGVLHVFDTSEGDNVGIGYGVATFGSSDNAITAGAGVAYSGDSRGGIAMLGGERRISRNIKLITENYIWQDGGGIISGGVRFIGERLSADLATGDAHRRRLRHAGGEFCVCVLKLSALSSQLSALDTGCRLRLELVADS